MNLFKRLSLAIVSIAFCMGIFAATSHAQWNRNRSWQNQDRNWQNQSWRNRGWQYGRISPQEYRRLSRERYRIYRSRQRAYSDGYVTGNERRRLYRQTERYRSNVRRDRRDWN